MSLVWLVNPDRLRALDLSNLLINYSLSHRSRTEPDLVERVSAWVFRNDIELSLGEEELRTLGAALPDGTFANLGLLLSDQCPSTVKAAFFADDDRNIFTAREEYTGSVLSSSLMHMRFSSTTTVTEPSIRLTPNTFTVFPAQPQCGWHAGDRSKR